MTYRHGNLTQKHVEVIIDTVSYLRNKKGLHAVTRQSIANNLEVALEAMYVAGFTVVPRGRLDAIKILFDRLET